MTSTVSRRLNLLLLAAFVLIPSLDTVHKYLGLGGLAAYLIIGTALIFLYIQVGIPALSRLPEKYANILAAITLVALALLVFVLYPLANSGRYGPGTDADEGLVTLATEMLNGNYPYYARTYLGNLITPLPGAILLAIPFVVLGIFPIHNVFWLAVFYLAARRFVGGSAMALGLTWLLLVFSPTVLWNFATGADYAANTIYVLVFMWLLITGVAQPAAKVWRWVLPAILLGIGLSSRLNFAMLLPILFAVLIQLGGLRKAIVSGAIAGTVFLLITLPFWIYDPAGFAPFQTHASKLDMIEGFLPYAGLLLPASMFILSAVLAFRQYRPHLALFFRNCAIIQLCALLLVAALRSAAVGSLDLYLGQAGYGMFTLFFGAAGMWILLTAPNEPLRSSALPSLSHDPDQ